MQTKPVSHNRHKHMSCIYTQLERNSYEATSYTVMITIIFYFFILDRESNSLIFAIFCPIPNKCLVAIVALLATSKEFVLILLGTCLPKRPSVTFRNLLLHK